MTDVKHIWNRQNILQTTSSGSTGAILDRWQALFFKIVSKIFKDIFPAVTIQWERQWSEGSRNISTELENQWTMKYKDWNTSSEFMISKRWKHLPIGRAYCKYKMKSKLFEHMDPMLITEFLLSNLHAKVVSFKMGLQNFLCKAKWHGRLPQVWLQDGGRTLVSPGEEPIKVYWQSSVSIWVRGWKCISPTT